MGAALRQFERDGAANAARGAGDQGNAAGEFLFRVNHLVWFFL
jgi:hypothetical protein